MVTDKQVRELSRLKQQRKPLSVSALKTGMDEKTARKYLRVGRLPSELKQPREWRTREDPFAEVWLEFEAKLKLNPGLEAKTLFEEVQRRCPGRFPDGQLRTLQRRVKEWRATYGPPKEVFFAQEYVPGERCQSDFTHLDNLRVTLQGRPFPHRAYHFVLAYSKWETVTLCSSESFESVSQGLQNALFALGGVPRLHQTDRLSTAVQKLKGQAAFTERYAALLRHYGLEGRYTQAASPHENGVVEQRHHRFKRALDQQLLLRGSRDFESREAYERFVRQLLDQLNAGRQAKLAEERALFRALPSRRLEACTFLRSRVGSGSTISVQGNVYSVHSRLIGEQVEVRIYADHLEAWYAQRQQETLPRLSGRQKHAIQYRHVLDWLVRKPGAFAQYRYQQDLFPTSRFRVAYDALHKRHAPRVADREYLRLLTLARDNETGVENVLCALLGRDQPLSIEAVAAELAADQRPQRAEVQVAPVDLRRYDTLLGNSVQTVPGVTACLS